MLAEKKFGFKKLWPKKNVGQKQIGQKKNFAPKKCWPKKNVGPKKFGSEIILANKNLGQEFFFLSGWSKLIIEKKQA